MIFYNNSKSKLFLLAVLVVLTSGLIMWQWSKVAPWKKIVSRPSGEWQEIQGEVGKTAANIKDSFGAAKDQFNSLQTEIGKEQERQELLNVANQYINDKNINTQENKINE